MSISAQQALAYEQEKIGQESDDDSVHTTTANILISTASYDLSPGESITFAVINPLIRPKVNINTTIVFASNGNGQPTLTLSGQTWGLVYFTVNNSSSKVKMNSFLNIAVLIY